MSSINYTTLRFTVLCAKPYTRNSKPETRNPKPKTRNQMEAQKGGCDEVILTPHTLDLNPFTPHPDPPPFTLPHTLHPTPFTLHCTPCTLIPNP